MAEAGLVISLIVQAIAIVFFATDIASFVSLVKGCFLLRRLARTARQDYGMALLKSPMVPPVSTIAAPPDASPESLRFIRRLLDLHFGRNEVVIVLDGPTDADLEIWNRELKLCGSSRVVSDKLKTQPVRGVYESRDPVRVVVIDKVQGGPVDAWNAGVNASTSPVIGILDPASEFVPEVLLRLIQPMLESGEETIAVSGGVCAAPGEGMAAQFGALESLRSWLTRGASFASRNITLPFPGSSLLVRRRSIVAAGGFTGGGLELFVRLHALALAAQQPYRIVFLPDPISQARAPVTFDDLRLRVQQEQQEIIAAFRDRVAIAGPFGWKVLRGLYYHWVVMPALELAVYALAIIGLILGWVDVFTVLLVVLSTIGMGTVLSMAAVVLREVAEPNSPNERRMASLFFAAIPENLIYRQRRNGWLIGSFRKPAGDQNRNRGTVTDSQPPAVSAASR